MACRIHNILDRTDSEKMLHHGISSEKRSYTAMTTYTYFFSYHQIVTDLLKMAKKTTNELSALVSIYNDRWRQYSFAIMPSVDNMSNVSLDLLFVVCWQCSLGTYLNTY